MRIEIVPKKQLLVKRSKLPGSGKGLFTKVFIPRSSLIVEYTGRVSAWKEVKYKPDNGYIFYVNRNHVIDAFPHKAALARYANDAKGMVKVTGVKNNAEYITRGLKVYIKATRDIQPGEEILVGYGKEYWDIMKENKKN